MTENTMLKALLSGGDRSGDGRLSEVAKLLTEIPIPQRETGVCISRETYDSLLNTRQVLVEAAVAAARAVVEFDERLGHFYLSCSTKPQYRGLGPAVRAAASAIVCASDWVALQMLCNERGIGLTEKQLVDLVAREAPWAPQPKRQGLQNAWWNTRHRRFPDWLPEKIRSDKFRRHCAVAAAALPFLPAEEASR